LQSQLRGRQRSAETAGAGHGEKLMRHWDGLVVVASEPRPRHLKLLIYCEELADHRACSHRAGAGDVVVGSPTTCEGQRRSSSCCLGGTACP